MAIALVVLAVLIAYGVYHSGIVALVLSLPDGNEDFVFTGECRGGGKMAESAIARSIPQKDRGTVPQGQSPSLT